VTRITIRRTHDHELVRELNHECFPHDPDMQPDTYDCSLWWIAYAGKEPVGYAGLYVGIRGQAWLVRVGVRKQWRGGGIGARLLRVRLRAALAMTEDQPEILTYCADWNEASQRNLISAGLRPYLALTGWIYYRLPRQGQP
jgi:GNAT superfamily N-acetyltransferase